MTHAEDDGMSDTGAVNWHLVRSRLLCHCAATRGGSIHRAYSIGYMSIRLAFCRARLMLLPMRWSLSPSAESSTGRLELRGDHGGAVRRQAGFGSTEDRRTKGSKELQIEERANSPLLREGPRRGTVPYGRSPPASPHPPSLAGLADEEPGYSQGNDSG
jgi:hypothetical protein